MRHAGIYKREINSCKQLSKELLRPDGQKRTLPSVWSDGILFLFILSHSCPTSKQWAQTVTAPAVTSSYFPCFQFVLCVPPLPPPFSMLSVSDSSWALLTHLLHLVSLSLPECHWAKLGVRRVSCPNVGPGCVNLFFFSLVWVQATVQTPRLSTLPSPEMQLWRPKRLVGLPAKLQLTIHCTVVLQSNHKKTR